MIQVSEKELDSALAELYELIHPYDAGIVQAAYASRPEMVRDVLRQSAEVLMRAKCIAPTAGEVEFDAGCGELITLSFVHPEVRGLFRIFVAADRMEEESDRMLDPAMREVASQRIERVMSCLG